MRFRTIRSGSLAGLVAGTALLVSTAPASAEPGAASAYTAKVEVTLLGKPVTVGPLSPSSSSGPTSASLVDLNLVGLVTAKAVASMSTVDDATGATWAEAEVAAVDVLLGAILGGEQKLQAEAITASCDATQQMPPQGTTTIVGLTLPDGKQVPVNPEPNTTIDLSPLAKIVFNEQTVGADGTLTVNAVHVTLLKDSGLADTVSGDVVLSSATCGPAIPAPPIPLASGAGLWLGLAVLGLAAVPVSVVVIRRRQAQAVSSS
jgi:hypothetical protein